MSTRPLRLSRIPFASLKAHRLRTFILILLTLVQAACATMGLVLIQSMRAEFSLAQDRLGADVLVYPSAGFRQLDASCVQMLGTPVQYHRPRSTLQLLNANDDITQVTYQIYLSDTSEGKDPLWIIGYDPTSDFVVSPWFEGGPRVSVPEGSIALGADIAEGSHELSLFGRSWPVAARLERTGSDYDSAVFVPVSTLSTVIEDAKTQGGDSFEDVDPARDYSVAFLRLGDSRDAQSVANWVNLYVRRVEAVYSNEGLVSSSASISSHSILISILVAVTWVLLVGALAFAQLLMMNERGKEMAVWASVGTSPSVVKRLFRAEFLLAHAPGALVGVGGILAWQAMHPIVPSAHDLLALGDIAVCGGLAWVFTMILSWLGACIAVSHTVRAEPGSFLLAE